MSLSKSLVRLELPVKEGVRIERQQFYFWNYMPETPTASLQGVICVRSTTSDQGGIRWTGFLESIIGRGNGPMAQAYQVGSPVTGRATELYYLCTANEISEVELIYQEFALKPAEADIQHLPQPTQMYIRARMRDVGKWEAMEKAIQAGALDDRRLA